mmetsp:Transcript_9692/g.35495  ORF Transcript_9692/g.35495 Transcript_9692/m.35495 type:complete len:750 (-) Transcript_9692:1617-3866(-)
MEVGTTSRLLELQGLCKTDPEGYREDFELQLRHYKASLSLFLLKPSDESKHFGELALFLAQVSHVYKKNVKDVPAELAHLLEKHHEILHPQLRRTLVNALMLLRRRGAVHSNQVLPLFFRLFRCQDKQLRRALFKHIVSDIREVNKKHRNESTNKALQNFLFEMVADTESESVARRSLSVLVDLYRRGVWADSKSISVIASACLHPSVRVMTPGLHFFMGHDQEEEDDSEDESDDDEGQDPKQRTKRQDKDGGIQPTKDELYSAYHKGTAASKKKKQAKLKRVLKTARKALNNETASPASFTAIQLLRDPQGFAERLFQRLQKIHTNFETKLLMLNVISRVIGVHQLLVLPFYTYIQRYLQPHQREVTHLLAAAVQACHPLVPPDAIEGLLKQIVNHFVHDRARPEVVTIGIKTVQEMSLRTPLVMTEDLLRDLTEYKKFKDKGVRMAARSLIGLFREIDPHMLARKDRGRGADMDKQRSTYGAIDVTVRVPGAELLQRAEEAKPEDEGEGSDCGSPEESDVEDDGAANEAEQDLETSGDDVAEDTEEGQPQTVVGVEGDSDINEVETMEDEKPVAKMSLRELRAATKARLAAQRAKEAEERARAEADAAAAAAKVQPLEMDRILSPEDFARIRELRAEQAVEVAKAKHGLKAIVGEMRSERKVRPDDLLGVHKRRLDKEERLRSVMEGREDREFGAKARKTKTGSKSNKEKEKKKRLPAAMARLKAQSRISKRNKPKARKAFLGKMRK